MRKNITLIEARRLVRSRAVLTMHGWRDRDVRRAIDAGGLRRIQRNRYVDAADWESLWAESRHLVEVIAAVEEMRGGNAIVSHASAAVLHGLPLYRHTPPAVHVILPGPSRMPSRGGLVRHRDRLDEDDIATVDGIRCTTLERTVLDVCRTMDADTALVVADAALRGFAFDGRDYDENAAERWRSHLLERAAGERGVRGIRQAAEVIALADGRAESPDESVARRRWVQVGYPNVHPQMSVRVASGRIRRVDIGLPDLQALFELDGRGKYVDERLRQGRSIEQVVLDEKRREDELRAATSWRMIRAEDRHILTVDAFVAHLSTYGISPRR